MINKGCTPQMKPVTERERDKTKGLVVIADNISCVVATSVSGKWCPETPSTSLLIHGNHSPHSRLSTLHVPQESRTQENFPVYVRKRFETIEN
jgi:hypothetical protein